MQKIQESAIYQGDVVHQRFLPKHHKFTYSMFFFWLKLSEITDELNFVNYFSVNKRSLYQFKVSDYFPYKQPQTPQELASAVKAKMQDLGASDVSGEIYFFGQVRALGIFFSPVNFYFHKPTTSDECNWMLAEVSNTPWNERHYYLVDMYNQKDTDKQFHVSPFNPIDMQYKWQVGQPNNSFNLALSCYKSERHFTASLALKKHALSSKNMKRLVFKIPSTTLFSLIGIYWQALKLFIKRVPIYSHSPVLKEDNHNVSK